MEYKLVTCELMSYQLRLLGRWGGVEWDGVVGWGGVDGWMGLGAHMGKT